MPKYDFDSDFTEFIPNLPTVQDFSTLEAIQEARAARMLAQFVPPDRDDVAVDAGLSGHTLLEPAQRDLELASLSRPRLCG